MNPKNKNDNTGARFEADIDSLYDEPEEDSEEGEEKEE